jgi:hypothetical protein
VALGGGRLARIALGAALALGAVALALFVAARGGAGDAGAALVQADELSADQERAAQARPRRRELPRGGYSVLPQYRPIGFYGAPQSPELGELGIGSPESAAKRLRKQIRPYKKLAKKPIYPLFELLGTIALAGPGKDGLYRARQPNRIIRRYAKVARERRLYLLLDIQPGRARFIDEVKHLRKWLRRPNVSIALDPEWNMGRNGVPGKRIGSVHAGMINRVTLYLNRLIRRHRLPDKLVVVHQFTDSMIRAKHKLKQRSRIDLVLNADGFGTPGQKRQKYKELAPRKGSWKRPGFKLFYKEDTNLMSPREVMRLRPKPSFIVYE